MLPSWMRSRNCRPRFVYFLAMEITRRRLASTISFLACRASRSPFCTMWTILRNSWISRPVSAARLWMSCRMSLIGVLVVGDEVLPAAGAELGDAQQPVGVELRALVVLQEVLARHAIALGQAHQAAFEADQALVDVVELLDQRLDAVLVERQRLHVGDDLFLELLVLALLGGRERRVLQLGLDVLVLQPAQLLVGVGDAVEGLEHLRLQLGFHGRQGDVVLHVVFRRGRPRGSAARRRRASARAGLGATGSLPRPRAWVAPLPSGPA